MPVEAKINVLRYSLVDVDSGFDFGCVRTIGKVKVRQFDTALHDIAGVAYF